MPIYIKRDADGAIVSWAKQPEIGHEAIDFDGELVRGYDEKFYKVGEEPSLPVSRIFLNLRAARAARLSETDKYILADYPVSEKALEQIKVYRAALRDLPDQPGAPWDGGGEETPWPTKPEI